MKKEKNWSTGITDWNGVVFTNTGNVLLPNSGGSPFAKITPPNPISSISIGTKSAIVSSNTKFRVGDYSYYNDEALVKVVSEDAEEIYRVYQEAGEERAKKAVKQAILGTDKKYALDNLIKFLMTFTEVRFVHYVIDIEVIKHVGSMSHYALATLFKEGFATMSYDEILDINFAAGYFLDFKSLMFNPVILDQLSTDCLFWAFTNSHVQYCSNQLPNRYELVAEIMDPVIEKCRPEVVHLWKKYKLDFNFSCSEKTFDGSSSSFELLKELYEGWVVEDEE